MTSRIAREKTSCGFLGHAKASILSEPMDPSSIDFRGGERRRGYGFRCGRWRAKEADSECQFSMLIFIPFSLSLCYDDDDDLPFHPRQHTHNDVAKATTQPPSSDVSPKASFLVTSVTSSVPRIGSQSLG